MFIQAYLKKIAEKNKTSSPHKKLVPLDPKKKIRCILRKRNIMWVKEKNVVDGSSEFKFIIRKTFNR